jgi:oligoendopeptidase F
MGHAFHGSLSKKQKNLVYNTPLTLAETASIFNETLMFETLLEMTDNKSDRNKLICNRLDDIFSTIFRQVMYVKFERRCHESFQRNEPLTFDDYNKMWIEESKELLGPDVNADENLIKHGWSAISHIFQSPFYCYTYAFGNIISLNLYQTYKNTSDKKEFLVKYHEFLAAGGSDTPENLLSNIFDMKFDDKFYSVAFSNIDELINKLDK